MTRLSVIVISRNEGAMLARTVRALRATVPPGSEIIVVDDDSSDGSAEALGGVTVVRRSPRVGVARARNAGAAAATGDLLAFCDAHVAPRPGWAERLVAAAMTPGVGAVAPTVTPLSGPEALGRGMTWTGPALGLTWLTRGGPAPLLCGCFTAMSRSSFARAGGFDEAFGPYGGEDIEMSVRLWRLGLACVVEPRAVVGHRFRRPAPPELGAGDGVYNRLRIATLHFGPEELAATRRALGPPAAIAAADTRLAASGIAERRRALDAVAAVAPEWFFRRFGLAWSREAA